MFLSHPSAYARPYQWEEGKILLESLIKACKLENDTVKCRLPIQVGLLELLLFELQRVFANQPYLKSLYKAIFSIMYYGLMRICEVTVTSSNHTVRAKDLHIGRNKDKILIVL